MLIHNLQLFNYDILNYHHLIAKLGLNLAHSQINFAFFKHFATTNLALTTMLCYVFMNLHTNEIKLIF